MGADNSRDFYVVTPNLASRARVPRTESAMGYSPGYMIQIGDSFTRTYFDDSSNHPSMMSTCRGFDNCPESKSERFFEIKPTENNASVDEIKALITSESVRALEDMPSDLKPNIAFLKSKDWYDEEYFSSKIRSALCACIKTNEPAIVRAVNAALPKISLDGKPLGDIGCMEPLVSKLNLPEFFLSKIFTKVQAARPNSKKVNSKQNGAHFMEIKFQKTPLKLLSGKENTKVCFEKGSQIINLKKGMLLKTSGSCSKKEMQSAQSKLNQGGLMAEIKSHSILVKQN